MPHGFKITCLSPAGSVRNICVVSCGLHVVLPSPTLSDSIAVPVFPELFGFSLFPLSSLAFPTSTLDEAMRIPHGSPLSCPAATRSSTQHPRGHDVSKWVQLPICRARSSVHRQSFFNCTPENKSMSGGSYPEFLLGGKIKGCRFQGNVRRVQGSGFGDEEG